MLTRPEIITEPEAVRFTNLNYSRFGAYAARAYSGARQFFFAKLFALEKKQTRVTIVEITLNSIGPRCVSELFLRLIDRKRR